MTLVSTIITDAYRESNLIPLTSTPNANQITEALRRLNTILISSVGNEAGDGLTEYNIEGSFTEESLSTPWIPDNARFMLNNTSAKTYKLDPYPQEGQRFSIVDVLGNLATFNVTLNPNGRRIENASTLVLNANNTNRQWLYRSDTGNWVRIADVISSDEIPFPIEFDDYFVISLAFRLNPRYGQMISQETLQAFNRARSQFRARYRPVREVESDLSPRDWLADKRGSGQRYSDNDFVTGRIYPWY